MGASERARAPRVRVWLRVVVFIALNVVVVLGALYVPHAVRVARLRKQRPWMTLEEGAKQLHVAPSVLHVFGAVTGDARRDWASLPRRHPGTIRIGAFGDSFTYGEEVQPGADYPSKLRALLVARGLRNVEVLNFGFSWTGLDQSTILWDRLGRSFGLDVVLLGPHGYWIDREQTFNHGVELGQPYYIHGRYVIDGDGVRLVEPAGGYSTDDRFEAYFSFFPRWRYLRYDRAAPQAMQLFSSATRQERNPFYYTTLSADEERARIDRVLFEKFERGVPQTVALFGDRGLAPLATGVGPGLAAVEMDLPGWFPYRRPRRHLSALGNALVARVYLDLLMGATRSEQALLHIEDLRVEAGAPQDLAVWHALHVLIAGGLVGRLMRETPGPDEEVFLDRESIHSLVLLRSGPTALDTVYAYAPPKPARIGAPAALVGNVGGREVRVALGATSALGGLPSIVVVETPTLQLNSPSEVRIESTTLSGASSAVLEVDGTPLLDLVPSSAATFSVRPHAGTQRYRLSTPDHEMIDDTELPPTGEVALELSTAERRMSFTIAAWTKRRVVIEPTAHFRKILRVSSLGIASLVDATP